MKIVNIIIKEVKHGLRNFKSMSMMVLFPIIIIVVFGLAFSNMFGGGKVPKIKDAKVLYSFEGGRSTEPAFKQVFEEGSKMGFAFIEAANAQEGMDSVSGLKSACYIRINDNGPKVVLFKNERMNFEASMIETMLQTFVQRYNVMTEISSLAPASFSSMQESGKPDFVESFQLDGKKQPGSTDFYAVTMLTMIILYASASSFWSVQSEKTQKTGSRMLCTPVKKYEILGGKTLGVSVITIIQVSIVILFSRFVLKAYWGENMWGIIPVLVSEILMSVSIGMVFAYAFRNRNLASALLNLVPMFVAFLGGSYVPLDVFNSTFLTNLASVSPLKWTNDAIFKVIYTGSTDLVPIAIIINITIALILIFVSSGLYRKETA